MPAHERPPSNITFSQVCELYNSKKGELSGEPIRYVKDIETDRGGGPRERVSCLLLPAKFGPPPLNLVKRLAENSVQG